MIILSDGNPKVMKCWGKGKTISAQYRLIDYVIQYEENGRLALLNTVTGEVVMLDDKEKEIVRQLPLTYQPEMAALVENHYLVKMDLDEKAEIDKLRRIMKLLDHNGQITSFTILPTTACNARCFYCYESNYQHISMSDETIEKTIRFIKQNCRKNKVSINWFGGEPLLGLKVIDRISQALTDHGYELNASMTTNGYLFTPEIVARASSLWKLKSVQITLDGTETIYNQVKNYHGVSGSPYYHVLDNIETLVKNNITVSVRVNLDEHNMEDIYVLIDELLSRFADYQNFLIYPHLLYQDQGFQPVVHSIEEQSVLKETIVKVESLLKEKKHAAERHLLPSLSVNCCMADNAHHIMIHPEGSLVRCEHAYFDDSVGTLDNGITNLERFNWWDEIETGDYCSHCVLYPTCIIAKHCPVHEPCTRQNVEKNIAHYQDEIKRVIEKNL